MGMLKYTILFIIAISFVKSTCVGGVAESPCFTCYANNNNLCGSCVAGYGLPGGAYSSDCTQCNVGEYSNAVNKECVMGCNDGETISSDGLKCTTICKPNEYKSATHCISCELSIPNCAACSSDNTCLSCKDGFLSLDRRRCGSDCEIGEMKDQYARACKLIYNAFGYIKLVSWAISFIMVLLF